MDTDNDLVKAARAGEPQAKLWEIAFLSWADNDACELVSCRQTRQRILRPTRPILLYVVSEQDTSPDVIEVSTGGPSALQNAITTMAGDHKAAGGAGEYATQSLKVKVELICVTSLFMVNEGAIDVDCPKENAAALTTMILCEHEPARRFDSGPLLGVPPHW